MPGQGIRRPARACSVRPDWDGPSIDITQAGYKIMTPSEQAFKYLRHGPPVVLTDVRIEKVPYLLIE